MRVNGHRSETLGFLLHPESRSDQDFGNQELYFINAMDKALENNYTSEYEDIMIKYFRQLQIEQSYDNK